mmetsp:Transcript_22820/g.26840  ORF Transcript_22820/g.26840 Transcript_22820/m.26840 type:complete len:360 (+) Transcript_22820:65-1144(+)|eukprot:CAMPEP_0114360020 /NCGR_PEP_ID=MMETSP0101-20121206/23494_1 /TAXON_ID=38822 ORGANISM="Pteridomonas danica, Strain PT" /NCGR_SAMPLE_ID=MMETSP0101 /ASSEMBLY_ACC=CAM_ASM_000211 /LENGTH=359 /DNA_ID=CAMNT_0001503935 /DNA_START=9 /DNA_END=1088 /DNA_ORIENTATION=-
MSALTDIDEKIKAAKSQCEALKNKIDDIRTKLHTNDDSMSNARKDKQLDGLESSPKLRRKLTGHFGKVYSMHWAGDSTHLVSASQDGKLIVWNGVTNNKVQSIPLRSSWVMTCAYEDKDNNMVACGGLDNLCSIYNLDQPQVLRASRELSGHDGYLSCCRFVGPSKILTSSGDSTCRYWDVERGEAIAVFPDHGQDVMSVAVSPVGEEIFISGSCDSSAKVWDIRTGKCTHTFLGHQSDVNSVNFFPDGRAFGTGSDDASCCFFDMRSYGTVNSFASPRIMCAITSVAFTKSGRILFSGCDDFAINGWDTTSPKSNETPAFQFTPVNGGHDNRVSCLGITPNGQALCTGSWDNILKIWA